MKRGVAQLCDNTKRPKMEQSVGGALIVSGVWACVTCFCAGSMDDDNRKLAWTLDALAMADPFEQEQEVDNDIIGCLMYACSFVCSEWLLVGVLV